MKEAGESLPRVDSSTPLTHHDPNDLGSLILIQIIPKKRTLNVDKLKGTSLVSGTDIHIQTLRTCIFLRHSTLNSDCKQSIS